MLLIGASCLLETLYRRGIPAGEGQMREGNSNRHDANRGHEDDIGQKNEEQHQDDEPMEMPDVNDEAVEGIVNSSCQEEEGHWLKKSKSKIEENQINFFLNIRGVGLRSLEDF